MIYKAKTHTTLIIFYLLLTPAFLASASSKSLLLFIILYMLFLLAVFFTRFEFSIHNSLLRYKVILFGFCLYKKNIRAEDIQLVLFKRVGWVGKGAVVQLKKGWNVRLSYFEPSEVYSHLLRFSEEHQIPIQKTNGFAILEQ